MSVPNIEKLFQYLQCFSKDGIEFNGITISEPITSVKLNSKAFYTDYCDNCGCCDPPESNLYSKSEYLRILNCKDEVFTEYGLDPSYLHTLRDGLHLRKANINGEDVELYEFKQLENIMYLPNRGKEIKRCTWCFKSEDNKFKCRIHPVESITCIMPHLRVFHIKGTGRSSIGICQFGRNHMLKCPVILKPPEDEIQFNKNKDNVIFKLSRLNEVGLDLNIKTHLPRVIEYISEITFKNHKDAIGKNMITSYQRKLF